MSIAYLQSGPELGVQFLSPLISLFERAPHHEAVHRAISRGGGPPKPLAGLCDMHGACTRVHHERACGSERSRSIADEEAFLEGYVYGNNFATASAVIPRNAMNVIPELWKCETALARFGALTKTSNSVQKDLAASVTVV